MNASHNLTSCYVPSLCDSVIFRSFLTSVCLSLFGSGDRSTCSTLLLPWKYPGRLSALQSYVSSLLLFSSSLSEPLCTDHTYSALYMHTHDCRGIFCFLFDAKKLSEPTLHLFMCSTKTHTAGLCKSAYRGSVLAGLTVVGACVADTAFGECSVKHQSHTCVFMCVRAYPETELIRRKAPCRMSVLTPVC